MVLPFLLFESWKTVLPLILIFSRPWNFSFLLKLSDKFFSFSGSLLPLFCILDEPPCYVRQCSLVCIFALDLYAYLIGLMCLECFGLSRGFG